jgi:hypothetical protein
LEEKNQIFIIRPKDVFEVVGRKTQGLDHEVIKLISLGPRNELLGCETGNN